MDHFEVRTYARGVRHLAIRCLSHVFVAAVKQLALAKSTGPDDQPTPRRDRTTRSAVGVELALFASAG